MTKLRVLAGAAFFGTYGRKRIFWVIIAFSLTPILIFLTDAVLAGAGTLAGNVITSGTWKISSLRLACAFAIALALIWFIPTILNNRHNLGFKAYFALGCYATLTAILAFGLWGFVLAKSLPRFAAIWGEPAIRSVVVEGHYTRTRKSTKIRVIRTNLIDLEFIEKMIEGHTLPEIGEKITFSGKETAFGFAFDYELR